MLKTIQLYTTSTSNGTINVDSDHKVTGRIHAVHVDLTGTNVSADIDLLSVADRNGNAVTFYSADAITSDVVVYPRTFTQNSGGTNTSTYDKFIIPGQTLRMSITNAVNQTGILTNIVYDDCGCG